MPDECLSDTRKFVGIFEFRDKQPQNRAKICEFHDKINIMANKINANSTICRYIEIWCPVLKIPHHSNADSSRLARLLALLALSLSKCPRSPTIRRSPGAG